MNPESSKILLHIKRIPLFRRFPKKKYQPFFFMLSIIAFVNRSSYYIFEIKLIFFESIFILIRGSEKYDKN
jgi:hypothetical protein